MASFQPPTAAVQHEDGVAAPDLASPKSQDSAIVINDQSVDENAAYLISAPTSAFAFRTTTIAPSPPPSNFAKSKEPSTLSALDTVSNLHHLDPHRHSPLGAGLHLETDVIPGYSLTPAADDKPSSVLQSVESSSPPTNLISPPPRTQSAKKALSGSIGAGSQFGSAPNSALSSPMLSAMTDVTPLPSPLMTGDSPGPWRKLVSRPTSREYMMLGAADSALVTTSGESITSAIVNQSKRRAYHGLMTSATESSPTDALINREKKDEGHGRNRSISEYVPEAVQVPKPRHQTVSGSHAGLADSSLDSVSPSEIHMRRERNLAIERGIAPVNRQENILPTPPASRTGAESSDSDSSVSNMPISVPRTRKPRYEYFDAHSRNDEKRRRWRALKVLGQGTFSKVMLATSQAPEEEDRINEDDASVDRMDGISRQIAPGIDRRKLVAVKICEHGPKGGASEERVEMSLKRELEIMKTINHPSLVHLKAWNIEDTRAILVLSYCPGGDLFEVASEHHDLLVPSLLQRMFAELVAAVQYLHERRIVHRDIKLENVLVNLPLNELAKPVNWVTYPYSVVTLTDLGLSRRVADDEKLTTRCGSDDYAAPEVIMGQPYDGRVVDAWSLGVLLYALLESRLPFDPTPGMSEGHKQRSKTSHRIARVEWCWVEYAGEDGDHEGDVAKFEQVGLKGAMDITEGLLKRARSRWTIQKVADEAWVKEAIVVEGGIKFREEDIPEEVSSPTTLWPDRRST